MNQTHRDTERRYKITDGALQWVHRMNKIAIFQGIEDKDDIIRISSELRCTFEWMGGITIV